MADVQFNLRIPEELKEQIKLAASKSGRSINGEAQYRLEQSFNQVMNVTPETLNYYVNTAVSHAVTSTIQNLTAGLIKSGVPTETISQAYLDSAQINTSTHED